jgi:ABC-2 type transport system permease protein
MFSKIQFHLAKVFLKIFLRDRQSIIFSLFFPFVFMGAFSFTGGEVDPFNIGLVNNSTSIVAKNFSELISSDSLFNVTKGNEKDLRYGLINGEQSAVIIIPKDFQLNNISGDLRLLLDKSQIRQLRSIKESLGQSLLSIERELRGVEPMFVLQTEDVKARSLRYVDFLLPGILAFMIMNLSIAGSGYNIVEYRRRGILKRLFVTPIQPKDFIISIVLARLLIVIMQISVTLSFAIFFIDVKILGSFLSLYIMIILGSSIFLCLGFCLGSIAKTQESVRAVGGLVTFPQLFLSGVFFPISSMPEIIQPIIHILPLTVVVRGMRGIANDGLSFADMNIVLIGIVAWLLISFVLATKLFVWKKVAN